MACVRLTKSIKKEHTVPMECINEGGGGGVV